MKRLAIALVFCPWIFLAPGAIGHEQTRPPPRPEAHATVSVGDEIVPTVTVKVDQFPATPTVQVGQLVRFDASKSDAEAIDWDCATEDGFVFDIPPGQDRIAYMSMPIVGKHRLRITGMKNAPNKPVFDSQVIYVVVTPRNPPNPPPDPNPPPPDPNPPPTPDPNPIVTKYGLTQLVIDLVTKNVPREKRPMCVKLSANYTTVIGMISQGKFTAAQEANDKVKELNGVTIPTKAEKDFWLAAVFTELNTKTTALSIKTLPEMSTVFSEIAVGFLIASVK